MITKDKVAEIFCIIDEFNKNLNTELKNNLFLPTNNGKGKRYRNRKGRLSESEIMTILVCYHFGTYCNLARVITEQVQFEAVAPTHSTFSVLRETGKYLVEITPYIMTYRYHGTVDKCYSRTFTKGIKLHKHHHLEENTQH